MINSRDIKRYKNAERLLKSRIEGPNGIPEYQQKINNDIINKANEINNINQRAYEDAMIENAMRREEYMNQYNNANNFNGGYVPFRHVRQNGPFREDYIPNYQTSGQTVTDNRYLDPNIYVSGKMQTKDAPLWVRRANKLAARNYIAGQNGISAGNARRLIRRDPEQLSKVNDYLEKNGINNAWSYGYKPEYASVNTWDSQQTGSTQQTASGQQTSPGQQTATVTSQQTAQNPQGSTAAQQQAQSSASQPTTAEQQQAAASQFAYGTNIGNSQNTGRVFYPKTNLDNDAYNEYSKYLNDYSYELYDNSTGKSINGFDRNKWMSGGYGDNYTWNGHTYKEAKRTQEELAKAGLYKGIIDGMWKDKTQAAYDQWLKNNNLSDLDLKGNAGQPRDNYLGVSSEPRMNVPSFQSLGELFEEKPKGQYYEYDYYEKPYYVTQEGEEYKTPRYIQRQLFNKETDNYWDQTYPENGGKVVKYVPMYEGAYDGLDGILYKERVKRNNDELKRQSDFYKQNNRNKRYYDIVKKASYGDIDKDPELKVGDKVIYTDEELKKFQPTLREYFQYEPYRQYGVQTYPDPRDYGYWEYDENSGEYVKHPVTEYFKYANY